MTYKHRCDLHAVHSVTIIMSEKILSAEFKVKAGSSQYYFSLKTASQSQAWEPLWGLSAVASCVVLGTNPR